MKANLTSGIAVAAVLAGIALLAFATGGVQHGPSWEVPAKAATNLLWALVASFVFDVVAVVVFLRGSRFRPQTASARWGFWIVLTFGVAASIGIGVFDPGQWPIQHPHLSNAARVASVPIMIACASLWVLFLALGWKHASRRT